ncbi:MAG: response regulator transcription factor [Planctomycetales bacterium]
MSIQILIADDHQVIRSGLISLVEDSDIQVIAEACDGEEAVQLALELQPVVVLLDVRLPDVNGLTILERLKRAQPLVPVLMWSAYDNPTHIARSVALGASGYMLKSCTRAELIEAIEAAARGETVWTQKTLRRVMGAMVTPRVRGDLDVPLTEREAEVLRELSQGLTNKEIAKGLGLSVETIKEHVQHILRKIGVTDRTQAAVWAVRNGLA